MKDRIFATVCWVLKRAIILVPSANLSCMVVDGLDSSTARPVDDEGVLLDAVAVSASSLPELFEDPLPSVLPAPWNGARRLAGSCQREIIRNPGLQENNEVNLKVYVTHTGQFSALLTRLTCTTDLLSAGSSSFGHSDFIMLCTKATKIATS